MQEVDEVMCEYCERRNQQEVQVMCKYCDFDEPCGKQVGEPFHEGFGVTAAIQQDRTFYSIVNTDGLDGIIYGINYCPMCGRKLTEAK